MPPSDELKLVVNDDAKAALERLLRIDPVTVTVRNVHQEGRTAHGEHRKGHITIFLGATRLDGSRLLHVNQEVVSTLLHEFRHEYQVTHWDTKRIEADSRRTYILQDAEIDANDFAARNVKKWLHLARVSRKTHSVFSAQNRRLARSGVGR